MMVLTLLLLAAAPATEGAAPNLPTYRCHATTRPVTIDGKLSDDAWSAAAWTADLVYLSGPGSPPRTRAKLAYDREHLYVAAELVDSDVRAEMKSQDDPLYRENAFEIFIDPDDDGQNYLELQVNALNTTFDLLMSKPYSQRGRASVKWDVEGLQTAVHVTGTLNDPRDRDDSWTVEIAIPWASLKEIAPASASLPPGPGSRWRVNLARVLTSRNPDERARYTTWSPIEGRSLHVPEQWGWVEFTESAEPAQPPADRGDTPGRASAPPAPTPP